MDSCSINHQKIFDKNPKQRLFQEKKTYIVPTEHEEVVGDVWYDLLHILASTMEIEINFRFDENGRTANTKANGGENEKKNSNSIDYSFKAEMTDLKEWFESPSKPSNPSSSTNHDGDNTILDEILLDCEISDNMIMPRTYWMPADGTTKPRCALEQFALDVFHHHVPSEGFDYDPETSGAEWWCQLRPSPETGRHKACANQCEEKEEDDPFANGISFHVDKDEELRILTGGSTYVHPHISTITYLTNLGSPTLIMDCQVHPLTGEWMVPEDTVEGFVSWPSVGKHTSFDGRYLHASPLDLMEEENSFSKQLESAMVALEKESKPVSKAKKRRCRRVTFLVNIWLNYKPYDVHPFPESMIDKMSGRDEKQRRGLGFSKTKLPSDAIHVQETCVQSDQAMCAKDGETTGQSSYKTQAFSWPLGDKQSGERLDCNVPLKSITEASDKGANVRIQWQRKHSPDGSCFILTDGKSATTVTAEPETANNRIEEGSSKRPRID